MRSATIVKFLRSSKSTTNDLKCMTNYSLHSWSIALWSSSSVDAKHSLQHSKSFQKVFYGINQTIALLKENLSTFFQQITNYKCITFCYVNVFLEANKDSSQLNYYWTTVSLNALWFPAQLVYPISFQYMLNRFKVTSCESTPSPLPPLLLRPCDRHPQKARVG